MAAEASLRRLFALPVLGLLVAALLTGALGYAGKAAPTAEDVLPAPSFGTESVVLTADLLRSLMEEDLAANAVYIERVRSRRDEHAAGLAEAAIRTPYLQRIEAILATGLDSAVLQVPVITVWGALRFSAFSYDRRLNPMDPVSVLFHGDAAIVDLYTRMTESAQAGLLYQDENGQMDAAAMRECRSGLQWVLMGNAGEPLQWRRSQRGLMRVGERCTSGARDHVRFFGDLYHARFGRWSVATPHREVWEPGRGHVIVSWNSAQDALAEFWRDQPSVPRLGGDAARLGVLPWGHAGQYQGVPFHGMGFVIGVSLHPGADVQARPQDP